MKTELTHFTCGGSTALAERSGKRDGIVRWRDARRRRLAYIEQPTEMQLARMALLDRQLEGQVLQRPGSGPPGQRR